MTTRSSDRSTLPTCRRSLTRAAITNSQRRVTRPPMSARSTGRVHRSRRTMHKVARPPQRDHRQDPKKSFSFIFHFAFHSSLHFSFVSHFQRSVSRVESPMPALLSSPWHGCRWLVSVPASSSLLRCPFIHSSYRTSASTAKTLGAS